MAPLKQKGDLAELAVALDLRRRGYRIAFPYGEDSDYDVTTVRCYYLPAALLGTGRAQLNLRLTPARNHQVRGVHMAVDFLEL